jgi:hypothetical protein
VQLGALLELEVRGACAEELVLQRGFLQRRHGYHKVLGDVQRGVLQRGVERRKVLEEVQRRGVAIGLQYERGRLGAVLELGVKGVGFARKTVGLGTVGFFAGRRNSIE